MNIYSKKVYSDKSITISILSRKVYERCELKNASEDKYLHRIAKGNFYLQKLMNFVYKNIRSIQKHLCILVSFYPKVGLKEELGKIDQRVPSDYDSIYYISVPTGEAYILSIMMPNILRKNCSKRPFFLFRNQQVKNIFHFFNRGKMSSEIWLLENDPKFREVFRYNYSFRNRNIYVFFPKRHYYYQDLEILNDKKGEKHFFYYICKKLRISESAIKLPVSHPSEDERCLLHEKIKNLKLNPKFVIFAPEARTASLYPLEFFLSLQKILKEKGVDVFWNTRKNIDGIKRFFLSHEEILLLATESKGIIGVRSCFFDVMSSLPTLPKYVLYTDFPFKEKSGGQHYVADQALRGFSLAKLPGAIPEIIFEYDTNKMTSDEIRDDILKNLSI